MIRPFAKCLLGIKSWGYFNGNDCVVYPSIVGKYIYVCGMPSGVILVMVLSSAESLTNNCINIYHAISLVHFFHSLTS